MPDSPRPYRMEGEEGDFTVHTTSDVGVKKLEAKPIPPPPAIWVFEIISEDVIVEFPPESSESIGESVEVTVT